MKGEGLHAVAPAFSGSPYRNAKYTKPSRGSITFLRDRILQVLFLVLGICYVGLIIYYRSMLAQDEASQQALSSTLTTLQDRHSEQMARQKAKLTEAQMALKTKEDALVKAERQLQAMDSVVEHLEKNQLVQALRKQNLFFNHLRWGKGPTRVVLEMRAVKGDDERAVEEVELEMAPFDVMPHVIHWFLTMVETGYWDGCHLIRNARHVLQFNCHARTAVTGNDRLLARVPGAGVADGKIGGFQSIVFQEFSPDFNHLPFTLGVAGRPGGEDFYVNLVENTISHGPGGQGPEPDPCFAKVVRGREVLEGWHGRLGNEFLDPKEYVLVKRMYIKG
ncbi:hypothetical protein VYU27_002505 [Nannochloropsis oceanica]